MKRITLLSVLFTLTFYTADAQIADTKWRGNLNIPDVVECILQFKKDTVIVLVAADQSFIVETMTYKLQNDTLTLTKVSGNSPCTETIGVYKCVLKEEKLYISPIKDECIERANAFLPEGLIKEK